MPVDRRSGGEKPTSSRAAGLAGLAACAELVVWVQSDRDEAHRRGLTRDVEIGRSSKEAAAFWDKWMRAEEPFLAVTRRACGFSSTPAVAVRRSPGG